MILDEVHSYDSYTGLLLGSLISLLRALHCTVILLSATLTHQHRVKLLGVDAASEAYPLISAIALDENRLREIPVPPPPARDVALMLCEKEQSAFDEALERAEQGQQILWIENTVAEAQDSYKQLAARASVSVEHGLLHSRFLPEDRARLETRWTGYYGKSGEKRGKCGRILVGTQVLEQSLDIDADFLVTRLCPVDMFLQRLGRLWRHALPGRTRGARPEAWLLAPPQADSLRMEDFGKSAFVYYPYTLFRSLEALRPLQSICLPEGIRPLLEDVYAERKENGLPGEWKSAMLQEVEQLARHARMAQSVLGQARNERIATRYSERDSMPVLLLRNMELQDKGMSLSFIDGSKKFFPRNIKAYDKVAWRELALMLDANTLSVAPHHAPQSPLSKKELEYFKNFVHLVTHGDGALRIAIVAESDELVALDKSPASDRYTLGYATHLGYTAKKK